MDDVHQEIVVVHSSEVSEVGHAKENRHADALERLKAPVDVGLLLERGYEPSRRSLGDKCIVVGQEGDLEQNPACPLLPEGYNPIVQCPRQLLTKEVKKGRTVDWVRPKGRIMPSMKPDIGACLVEHRVGD